MQPSSEARQPDGLICGMCGKYLHVPYTLPCKHSYCLEPCLVARPNQTEVKCSRCNRLYPLGFAASNTVLEKRIRQHYIEERRSCVATCNVCQHPAPALRDCQHCAARVCSSCWDSHYVKVVTSVTESISALLEKKKDLEEVRNLLRARSHREASHLRKFIEQATLVLRNACNKSLNLSTANLNNLYAEHRARLNASKGVVCNIRELIKKQLIPLMTLDTLLNMRDALEGVSSIAKRTSEGLDACRKRPNLSVDRSFTGALDTLLLIDAAHHAESKHRLRLCRRRAARSTSLREPKNFSDPKSLSPPSLASPRPLIPASHAEGRQKVFVGGISWKTTTDSLQSAFSKLGPIRKVDVYPTRGFAIVEFERPEMAELVVSARWHTVDDKRVEIQPYMPRKNANKSSDKQKTLSRISSTSSAVETLGLTGDRPMEDIPCRRLYGSTSHILSSQRLGHIPAPREKPETAGSGVAYTNAVSAITNARKLMIWGIGGGTTHATLRDYFINYGAVDHVSVTRTEAWVVFKNANTVNLVLATQPHFIRGRQLFLSKPDGKATFLVGKEATSTDAKTGHQLVVDGLPPLPRENDIRSLFGRFGTITEVRVDENAHRAFVDFSTAEALQRALAATPPRLKGMNLRVSLPAIHEYNTDVQVKKTDIQDSGVSDSIKWNRASVQSVDRVESDTKSELEKSSDGESKAGNSVHQDGGVPDPSTLIGDSVQNTERKELEPENKPKKWPTNGCLLQ
ncbi:RNA binding protein squid [Echinococcus multilocularis]|uniref:RNA binding protein squid n=1 Tax=Echinococcus multilocularis TaxID=6211 RepID=A0A068Y8V3_ECHMU|nr:RNA binding protein squid [Echinococcus multilocularis]